MKKVLATLLLTGAAAMSQAEVVVRNVAYEIDGQAFEGKLVYDDSVSTPRPGLLMVPNWMGVTDNAAQKAYRAGGSDYVVFIADMYGADTRPANSEEAAKAAGAVRANRALMRKRVNAALDVLREQAGEVALDTDRLGAIGFCFGGTSVLELARSGTEISGVVSFHGNLDTPDAADAQRIRTPVLALHGAIDPYVPEEQVAAFQKEMGDAGVDWQLVSYGGAVHSFTDPTANAKGQAEYHPQVAERAFTAMRAFFDETMHH